MGAVVNGNVWVGACVAGKEITGLVKNGVVFYKKYTTPSVYKRRIMVGDSLNSKILYITLPTDFVVQNNETIIETDVYNAIAKTTNSADTGTPNVDLCYVSSEFTFVGLIGKTQYEIPFDFGTVTSIIDTDDAYRHLFIEDPNIRPIEVGDKLVSGTKLYFIFPDNLTDILGYIDYEDSMFIAETEDGETSLFLYSSNIYDENKTTINMQWNGISSSAYPYLYEYDLIENKLISNLSSFILTDEYVDNKTNTVISINKNSPLYNYILIDMTTLGA